MSTWHQDQVSVRLYHDTDWTIVTDPPNQPRTLWREATREDAEATLARWSARYATDAKYSYILPPGIPQRGKERA
jgi:hypothetical protein